MKKLLLFLTLALLLAAGCQQPKTQPADNLAAEIAPGAYLISIPAEGWTQPTANLWVRQEDDLVLPDVRLWMRRLADCTTQQAAEILQSEGYVQMAAAESADMSRQEDGLIYMVRICPSDKDVWLVNYSYPAEAAAQWEPVLAELAASFAVQE